MDKLIAAFSQNIQLALDIAKKFNPRKPQTEIRNIVVCGMGGSGIGGKIVAQWFQNQLTVPFISVQDYELPAFVDNHSLVIASSYSGNTEETLTAVNTSLEVNATVIAICSGGKLETLAKEKGFDVVLVPGGNPPRAALAFSLVQLVNCLVKLDLVNDSALVELEKSAELIDKYENEIRSEAKKITLFIGKEIPVFYSSSDFEGIAIRARQQINENAKTLCWHHVIPEMNHNELVGWSGGTNNIRPIFIQNKNIHPRNAFRFDVSKNVMKEKCNDVYTILTKGDSVIEESIYVIHLVDWSSYYLSELKNEDPIAIPVIDFLKGELDKF